MRRGRAELVAAGGGRGAAGSGSEAAVRSSSDPAWEWWESGVKGGSFVPLACPQLAIFLGAPFVIPRCSWWNFDWIAGGIGVREVAALGVDLGRI